MKKYEIEHIGIAVEKPIEMANWYRDTLGFNIKFSAEDEEKGVAFLTDGSDRVMLELGRVPDVLPLTKGMSHHLQFHIALKSDDPDKRPNFWYQRAQSSSKNAPSGMPGENLIVLSDP
jgi:catechol-2,3-dioxygenase